MIDFQVNSADAGRMESTASSLPALLGALTAKARARGLTDAEWARRAHVRQETLSRLRRRDDCDLATLRALATQVDARLTVTDATTPDGLFPASLDRADEARLLALAAADASPQAWANAGPRFFMAGLAVMLASQPGEDRRKLLELAETLHPGASTPAVFGRWLQDSPLRPSRFLPMLEMERRRAA